MLIKNELVEKHLNRDIEKEKNDELKQRKLFQKVMLDFDIPPSNTLFPKEMIHILNLQTNETNQEGVKKKITEFIIKCYSEKDLKDILKFWEKQRICDTRIHILRDVIHGHLSGMYNLTIPTMLSQIEGIIVESSEHKGKITFDKQINYIEELLNDTREYSFDKAINKYYLKVILAGFRHGEKLKSDLSRHAILHGADTSFGNEFNSLKCILIFDYLLHNITKI